jgi:ABC-type multidrug transport system ATPase subunit
MQLMLEQAGKKFNREWIFRNFTYSFEQGKRYAITGPNGSGKSTLLQAIAGNIHLNEGKTVLYDNDATVIEPENQFAHLAITAPYLDVIEEMTVTEFLHFHAQFKPLVVGVSVAEILAEIGLAAAARKQIRHYSSGMKQRVKLAQAIFSDTAILLLDEPCTNLDASGYRLYHSLIQKYCSNKMVIVCSNDEQEFSFCDDTIAITSYK